MRARGKETRRAVLRAAERVFAERGYAGARMDDVAADVGIRRASMVYYFRDKRSLYLALLDDLFGNLFRQYEAALAEGGSAKDRILRCVDVWASHVTERPGMLRILFWEIARIRRSTVEPLVAEIAPMFTAVAEVIETGQREGTFRPVDPMRFMMTIAGATAFLTLGMTVLAADTRQLGAEDLRTELHSLSRRLLMDD